MGGPGLLCCRGMPVPGGSMSGHYMAFAATATLRLDAETFISNIHSGDKLP